MSKRFSILLVVLTIVSGLIGGLISGRIFAVNPAMAVEANQSKVLTTEELRIVDGSGKLLMTLGKERDEDKEIFDGYGLFIFGKDDKPKATMGVYAATDEFRGFGVVSVSGEKRKTMIYEDTFTVSSKDDIRHILIPRVTISVDDTIGSVFVSSEEGNTSAGMVVDESGSVISISKNRDGSPAVAMGTGEFGDGVYVYGKDNEARVSIGLLEDSGSVNVIGKDNLGIASMQVTSTGGVVGVTGKNGKGGAIMQVNEFGDGVISLWDKDGYQLGTPEANKTVEEYQRPPTITKVNPAMVSSVGGTEITIIGTGFEDFTVPTVTIGGNLATGVKVIAKTILKATVPAGVVGPADIVIQNARAKVKSLSFKGFTYYDNVTVMTSIPDMETAPEGIYPPARIDITFNQDVDPETVIVRVMNNVGDDVVGYVAQDAVDTKWFIFTPINPFKAGDYTITVSGAKGMAAQNIMADMSVAFKVKGITER